MARFAMEFCAIESCGKCTPCRIGSTRGVETLDKIRDGINVEKNLAVVEDLCDTMKFGSLCALGGFTPYPGRQRPYVISPRISAAGRASRQPSKGDPPCPSSKRSTTARPRSRSETLVTLFIDGVEVTVPEGTSIMRAAMEMGTQIPKLCATDMLEAFGSCRLCLVEIEGRNGTPASCTTPVAPGIKVDDPDRPACSASARA